MYNVYGEVHSPLHLAVPLLNGETVSHLPGLFLTAIILLLIFKRSFCTFRLFL